MPLEWLSFDKMGLRAELGASSSHDDGALHSSPPSLQTTGLETKSKRLRSVSLDNAKLPSSAQEFARFELERVRERASKFAQLL